MPHIITGEVFSGVECGLQIYMLTQKNVISSPEHLIFPNGRERGPFPFHVVFPNGSWRDLLPPSFLSILADSFAPGLFLSCRKSCFWHLTSGTGWSSWIGTSSSEFCGWEEGVQSPGWDHGPKSWVGGWGALGSRKTRDNFLNASLDLLDGAMGPEVILFSSLLLSPSYHLLRRNSTWKFSLHGKVVLLLFKKPYWLYSLTFKETWFLVLWISWVSIYHIFFFFFSFGCLFYKKERSISGGKV